MSTTIQKGPLSDLTAFQRDLLRTIAVLEDETDKVHGLAIKEAMEESRDGEVFHGRLYPNIDEVVELGLVEKSEWDRRTNTHGLTRRGRRELKAHVRWMQEPLQ